jgi:SOS response regulatory protein OraA/RecX
MKIDNCLVSTKQTITMETENVDNKLPNNLTLSLLNKENLDEVFSKYNIVNKYTPVLSNVINHLKTNSYLDDTKDMETMIEYVLKKGSTKDILDIVENSKYMLEKESIKKILKYSEILPEVEKEKLIDKIKKRHNLLNINIELKLENILEKYSDKIVGKPDFEKGLYGIEEKTLKENLDVFLSLLQKKDIDPNDMEVMVDYILKSANEFSHTEVCQTSIYNMAENATILSDKSIEAILKFDKIENSDKLKISLLNNKNIELSKKHVSSIIDSVLDNKDYNRELAKYRNLSYNDIEKLCNYELEKENLGGLGLKMDLFNNRNADLSFQQSQ